MAAQIDRHFVTVTGRFGMRQVHYRRSGSGPLVLLLHQSPQSSRDMIPLLHAWSGDFTLIAPDSPGYGCSDPLGQDELSLADFAAATIEFADAIAARRFGIYGYHTGASIGLLLAAQHPNRVCALAANGLIMLDERERERILASYLPPLKPAWDGSHLSWLWARLREQTMFFPWHERRAEARMDFDIPAPARLQASLLEFLGAGEHYASAYRAAFVYQPRADLQQLQVPALVTAAPPDPLAGHLARIGLPAASPIAVSPADSAADALARSHRLLQAHPGQHVTAQSTSPAADWQSRRILLSPGHGVHVCCEQYGDPDHQPIWLVHGAGGSAAALAPLARSLAARHCHVMVPDLPGHGASDALLNSGVGQLAGSLDLLAGLLADMAPDASLHGTGSGALLAQALADRCGLRQAVTMVDPPLLTASAAGRWQQEGLPVLEPLWHGGHLLEAWHMVRDGRLFYPWFERRRAAIRQGEPDLDVARIHHEVLDRLRSQAVWQELLGELLVRGPDLLAGARVSPRILFQDPALVPGTGAFAAHLPESLAWRHEPVLARAAGLPQG